MLGVRPLSRLALLGIAVLAISVAASAQGLGPELYGVVGNFGMGNPVSTRLLGMGAPLSCLNDAHFANPAFAAQQESPSVGLRLNRSAFDGGPRLNSLEAHYTLPLRSNETGLQLTILEVDSSGNPLTLPGMGPTAVNMSEHAWVVDYGRRLSPRLAAGLSVVGHEGVGVRFTSAAGPVLADLSDTADFGGRVGATYEWAPGDTLGLLYNFSQDTVETDGVALGGPGRKVFHTSQLVLGASERISSRIVAIAEFQRGMLLSGAFDSTSNTWRLGAELRAAPEWAVRAGLNDGNATFGLGWQGAHWRADYAFLRNWNDGDAGQLFGGSDTHSVELLYRW